MPPLVSISGGTDEIANAQPTAQADPAMEPVVVRTVARVEVTMMFMNEFDIAYARERFANHPTLGPATRFLSAFKDEVNAHSDGWPYWSPPVRAAGKLMELIEAFVLWDRREGMPNGGPSAAKIRAAVTPIKSFMKRRGNAAGMTLPPLEL